MGKDLITTTNSATQQTPIQSQEAGTAAANTTQSTLNVAAAPSGFARMRDCEECKKASLRVARNPSAEGSMPAQSGPSRRTQPEAAETRQWKMLDSELETLKDHVVGAIITETGAWKIPKDHKQKFVDLLTSVKALRQRLGGLTEQTQKAQETPETQAERVNLIKDTVDVASQIATAALNNPVAEHTRLLPLCAKVILHALAIAGIGLLAVPAILTATVVGIGAGPIITPIYMFYNHKKRKEMLAQWEKEHPNWRQKTIAKNALIAASGEKLREHGIPAMEAIPVDEDLPAEAGVPSKLEWWLAIPGLSSVFGKGMAWHPVGSKVSDWIDFHQNSIQWDLDARQHVLELQTNAPALLHKLQAKFQEANPGRSVSFTPASGLPVEKMALTPEMLKGKEIEVASF